MSSYYIASNKNNSEYCKKLTFEEVPINEYLLFLNIYLKNDKSIETCHEEEEKKLQL
jgi:hypothetical protein